MNNKEILTLLTRIENIHTGEPWFGRSVMELLKETEPDNANTSVHIPSGAEGHRLVEILWHMITWASFTLKRIQKDKKEDLAATELLDWRTIDPRTHTWKKGIQTFQKILKDIIELLRKKEDPFLDEKVDYRHYNFRYLINGMIDHHIYHIGQIAYINKLMP